MKEYLKSRLIDLRRLYRETGEGEYLYRTLEVQRVLEHLSKQEPRQIEQTNEPRTKWQTITKGQP
jgi:hypothetical protein